MKRLIIYAAIALTAFLPGLSRPALAQTQAPGAVTNAGPALTTSGSTTFLAWKGQNSPGHVWYSTLNGSVWAPVAQTNSETTAAPALAVANGTVYLAMKGQQQPTDDIYVASWTGSAFPAPTKVPNTETTAAPALAGDGSTLYAAWTTATNTIMYATYAGAWSAPVATPFSTNTQMAPALAVHSGALHLAWVAEGGSQVMYAKFPLPGGPWSSANPVGAAAQTSVAPALGVFDAPAAPPGGLFVAWTTATGQVDYSTFSAGSWQPPVLVPTGPLTTTDYTPALISFGPASCPYGDVGGPAYVFTVFYTLSNEDIYYFQDLLSYETTACRPSKPICPCPTCCT